MRAVSHQDTNTFSSCLSAVTNRHKTKMWGFFAVRTASNISFSSYERMNCTGSRGPLGLVYSHNPGRGVHGDQQPVAHNDKELIAL